MLNYKGEPIYYPAAYPPDFFKNAGEQAVNWRQMTMESDSPMQIPFEDLYKFRQGGEWDMQRLTGPVDANYIDYATVAIGIYGHSAEIPVDDILYIQNAYAGLKSNFGNSVEFDKFYTHFLVRNVYNNYKWYEF